MKSYRFLITLVLSIGFFTNNVIASDFSLFGFKLGEDVRKYISSENLGVSEPYNEAKEERGFRQVVLNDAPVKNGAFKFYSLGFDTGFRIHHISAFSEVAGLDYCLNQSVEWADKIGKRFKTVMLYDEDTSSGIEIRGYIGDVGYGDGLDVRCNRYDDGKVFLFILWRSAEIIKAISEFHKSYQKF